MNNTVTSKQYVPANYSYHDTYPPGFNTSVFIIIYNWTEPYVTKHFVMWQCITTDPWCFIELPDEVETCSVRTINQVLTFTHEGETFTSDEPAEIGICSGMCPSLQVRNGKQLQCTQSCSELNLSHHCFLIRSYCVLTWS